jgi:hypothetical protein
LRRTGHRQLSFVFADSPQGGGAAGASDASEGRAFLLHTAKRKRTARTVAGTADTCRLLEETVEEAEQDAAPLIAALRHALLTGCYRPGDVRRVWLPKPGGGQRGLGIDTAEDCPLTITVVPGSVLIVADPTSPDDAKMPAVMPMPWVMSIVPRW